MRPLAGKASPMRKHPMKCYMILTDTGPITVLTSHATIDPSLVEKLAAKGIDKFVACEIPIAVAEQRYGGHFRVVKEDLQESDDLRVLDEDGGRAFKLFRFDQLGPLIPFEALSRHRADEPIAKGDEERLAAGRYYIHLTDGIHVLNNHKGLELPGIAAARDLAAKTAHDLKHGAVLKGWNWAGWFVL